MASSSAGDVPRFSVKVVCLGFGHVGKAVVDLLLEREGAIGGADPLTGGRRIIDVTLVGLVNSTTAVFAADGLPDLESLRGGGGSGGLAAYADAQAEAESGAVRMAPEEMVVSSAVDVIIDVTPTNVTTGEPGLCLTRAALDAGKHVVAANKGPIALAFAELTGLASNRGVCMLYESTCLAGSPVVEAAKGLAAHPITAFDGIFNATTNFILGRMADGDGFDEVLAEAQKLGFAEADPSNDVDGWDTAVKTVIIANVAMGLNLTVADVDVSGIRAVTNEQLDDLASRDLVLKLVGGVEAGPTGSVRAFVETREFPSDHPLAAINGTNTALSLNSELMGLITIIGGGAGGRVTASGILADLTKCTPQQQQPSNRMDLLASRLRGEQP